MTMKIIKILSILLLVFFIGSFIAIKSFSSDPPTEIKGADADQMAHAMMDALNHEAWDSIAFVSFSFMGGHDYFWNKKDNEVVVKWKDISVQMDLESLEAKVVKDGQILEGKKKDKFKQKAWSFWCNDSFWFYAPFKVFDKGVERSVVDMEDGNKGLMVHYASGGVTPGDKYMWILDEHNLPTGWKMWVKIIPVKGIYTSWENYIELSSGAKVASLHENGKLTMELTNIKEGKSYADIGLNIEDLRTIRK